MIEPKPLTKQLREDMTSGAESGQISVWTNKGMLDVLADGAFWREALKKASFGDTCPFCGRLHFRHEPDCPWLLAQEDLNK